MDREEAFRLLWGGPKGVAEWNRRRKTGEAIPDLRGTDLDNTLFLSQTQVNAALGDARTTVPERFTRPAHWA